MTATSESVQPAGHFDAITRAAQWLADRHLIPNQNQNKLALPEIASRFCLTDADAAEAILLAGNFSICRRAFG